MTRALEVFLSNAIDQLPSFGIQQYVNKSVAEQNAHHLKTGVPFRNFQWVKLFKLARCAQPGYNGSHDTTQHITDEQLAFLKRKRISLVISLNNKPMHPDSVQQLRLHGIKVTQVRVKDFGGIGLVNLKRVVADIEASPQASLIYCGYGEGRTGTATSAWAIKKILEKQPRFFENFDWIKLGFFIHYAFGSETSVQFREIGEYLKTLAPPPVRINNIRRSTGIANNKCIPYFRQTPQSDIWEAYLTQVDTAMMIANNTAAYADAIRKFNSVANTHQNRYGGFTPQHAAFIANFKSNFAMAKPINAIIKLESKLKARFDQKLAQMTGPIVQYKPPQPPLQLPTLNDDDAPQGSFWANNNDQYDEPTTLWDVGSEDGLQAFD